MARFYHAAAIALALGASSEAVADEVPDFDFKSWTTARNLDGSRLHLYSLHQA